MQARQPNRRLRDLVQETARPYSGLAAQVNQRARSKYGLDLTYKAPAVSQWINQGTRPGPDVQAIVAEVLSEKLDRDIRAADIWPEDKQRFHHPPEYATLDGMDRRTVLFLIGEALGGLVIGAELERLTKPADGLAKADTAGVGVLQAGIANCRRLDDCFGSRAAARPALAQHQLVTKLLRRAQNEEIEQQLYASAAELSQLLGWLALDLNDAETARAHLYEALEAAHRADDDILGAYILGHLGIVSSENDRLSEALAYIFAAQSRAERAPRSTAHAWLWAVEAELRSLAGETTACLKALDRAQGVLDKVKPENAPAWIYFFDGAELASYRGACLEQLRRPQEARSVWEAVLASLQPSLVRDRAIYLTHLGATFLDEDELHEALTHLTKALSIATDTNSERAMRRVGQLKPQ